jgi:tRNA(Arg) A34 adenosine deaminase TadA
LNFTDPPEIAMNRTLALAEEQKTPFAAVLIDDDGHILAEAANTTGEDGPTAHAEINLIRKAFFENCLDRATTLVTTCEPCPMCMGAIAWTNLKKVVYAASIEKAAEYLPQIMITSRKVAEKAFRKIEVTGPYRESEAESLFRSFS